MSSNVITIPTILLDTLTAHNCSNSPNYNQANFPKLFTGKTFTSPSQIPNSPLSTDPSKRDDSLNPAAPMNISKQSLRTLMRPGWKGKLVSFWQAFLYNGVSHPEAGYHNDDPAVIKRQVVDTRERGFDTVALDWYGQKFAGAGNDLVLDAIAAGVATTGQSFYVTFDQQCLGGVNPATYQAAMISFINHIADRYFGNPGYERFNGRPLLAFWGFDQTVRGVRLDWNAIRAAVRGNPWFVLYQATGLTTPGSDGAMSWMPVSSVASNPSGSSYLKNYMLPAFGANPGKIAIGSAWARFNGTLTRKPSWSEGKSLDGVGGMTLLETMELNADYAGNLPYLQLVWDDLEEGTALINGVENDIAVTASITGTKLTWSVTGHEQTVAGYEVYASVNHGSGSGYLLGWVPASAPKEFDLRGRLTPYGGAPVYLRAVGKPCISNRTIQIPG